MAIALEFLDFIVPIAIIRKKYPGGWEQCLADHEELIGVTIWYDEHLWRDGAMSSADIEFTVKQWTKLGFEPNKKIRGKRVWNDCCVVQAPFGTTTLTCDWLVVSEDGHSAHLKGQDPGKLIGRYSYSVDND